MSEPVSGGRFPVTDREQRISQKSWPNLQPSRLVTCSACNEARFRGFDITRLIVAATQRMQFE